MVKKDKAMKNTIRRVIEFLQKCKPFLNDVLIGEYDEIRDILTLLLKKEIEKDDKNMSEKMQAHFKENK
jgi:hypothetical protein